MVQMMEQILAKIDSIQEEMRTTQVKTQAWQKEMTACQEATEACLEKVKANPEKINGDLEEMEVAVDFFKERVEQMDTTNLETNQEKLDAVAGHQGVPTEETTVETIEPV
jgi:chromosome segregation ATPase